MVADALESAAAEIERLRAELAATIRMTDESVRLAVRDERKAIEAEQAEAAQQGPSDEEIRGAIESVGTWGCRHSASALRLVARRAGVKL